MKTKFSYLYHFITTFTLILTILGCGAKKTTSAYVSLYPKAGEIASVQLNTKIVEYKDKTLYDLLNGGAELYIAYDIIAAVSAEYKTGQDSIIEVSIYDMGVSENAFGMYSTARYTSAEYVDIGNEAIKTSQTLDLWKGRYYCKLVAFDPTPESQKAMLELGKILANNIAETGTSPALIALLPTDAKIAKSEKYFRKQLSLNNIHYIDKENVLQLSDKTEGVVAQYQFGQTKVSGFVIKYPTAQNASAAYDSYRVYLSQKGTVSLQNNSAKVLFQNGKVTFIALRDNYLVGVWDAQDAEKNYEFVKKMLASVGREN